MNPVIHFEMPYDDPDRLAKFYKAAFNWMMRAMGEPMGNYVLATTIASSADGRPTNRARSTAASSRRSRTGPRSTRRW